MKLLQYLFWGICLYGCMEKSICDDYHPKFSSEQLIDTLNAIAGDSVRLRSFCTSWNRDVLPNTPENDTLKALYSLYDAFRNEPGIPPLAQWNSGSWHKLAEEKNLFLPLSSRIAYAVAEDSVQFWQMAYHFDTLTCFRPAVPRFAAHILYVTSELSEALNTYLGYNDPLIKGKTFFQSDDTLSYQRWQQYQIRRLQTGKVIAMNRDFRVFGILISPDLQSARVSLLFSGGGTEAVFKNENGIWRFQGNLKSWIE